MQLFVGDEIEDLAELAFLENITSKLQQYDRSAIILANFHCVGRQIDFVVATGSGAALFEIKSSVRPLKGAENGPWGREKSDGNWEDCSSGYQQALNAKNRLRDEMGKFKPIGKYYPSAFVVFPFGVPKGSQLGGGDFKVWVDRNDLVEQWLTLDEDFTWSLNDWSKFAERMSLKRADVASILAGQKNARQRAVLARYMAAFKDEYATQPWNWLSESEDQIASIREGLKSPHGLVIHGPSGCGKTLLAKRIACELTDQGSPCLFIAASEFTGDWRACLMREMAMLSNDSGQDVLMAMRAQSAPAYLVFDGLNELNHSIQARALRGMSALSRKFGFRIIVTHQNPPPQSLKALACFSLAPPSQALKRRIAEASGNLLNAAAVATLDAVGSGFEAYIIGELGNLESSIDTRPRLIDQFIRRRLSTHARDGSRACRHLAFEMTERIAFSISEIDLDDLFCEIGVTGSTVDALFENGLLARRGARVTFRHEIIQTACAAFRLAHLAVSNPSGMGRLFSSATHNYLAHDALSAIESVESCRVVLETVTDSELLAQAAIGRLGAIAQIAGEQLLLETKSSALNEISVVRLQYAGEGESKHIQWDPLTVSPRSPEEIARLRALGLLTVRGSALPNYLELCRAVDGRLNEERQRLSDLASLYKSPIKSDAFALAYGYGFGRPNIGFTTIASTLQSSFGMDRVVAALPLPSLLSSTSGEAYFYLETKRRVQTFWSNEEFAIQLCEFLEQRFRYEPYHLKLASLDACLGLQDIQPETRSRLQAAVHEILASTQNWAISTQAIDILRMTGALDNEAQEHRHFVRSQIEEVLTTSDMADGDRASMALSLYVGQFDHPYSTAYCEEWNCLSESQKKFLLRWAIKSPNLKNGLSLNWIVQEVAELGDPEDVELLRPFTLLPEANSFLPDDAMSAFCTACRAFGLHRVALSDIDPTGDRDRVLIQFRRLLSHLDADASAVAPIDIWEELAKLPLDKVLKCLAVLQRALNYWCPQSEQRLFGPVNIVERFAKECLLLSRRFVDAGKPTIQSGDQAILGTSADRIAFQIIENFGDRTDLERLRKANFRSEWAGYAVSAIRVLDSMREIG